VEDLRTYREEEQEPTRRQEEERRDFSAPQRDDEVPFHIPRD